ncbi:MAG TPA: hypothetical protein DCY89_09460 [Gammaproteobacteria bacterium]|nr:hypothetical protein [Gammaproteobacteria bacterium]
MYAVVLLLGLAFTLTLLALARDSALEAARREFALDSLGLRTRLSAALTATDDLLRTLARPPFALTSETLPEPEALRRQMDRLPFIEAITVRTGATARPAGNAASPRSLQLWREPMPAAARGEPDTVALAMAVGIALQRGEVIPVVEGELFALVYAACRSGVAGNGACADPFVTVARLSRPALLETLGPLGLALVVDVESEGLLGRRRLLDSRPAGLETGALLTARLVDDLRVILPGYHLRTELSRQVDVLRHGGGLLATALLVGGGATLLLVALVRTRGAQMQALAERNVEISRQVEAQTRELAAARDAALAAARAKAEFLATMSHEIRTPLNAIMGMSELLAESPLEVEQRQHVEVHRRASENLLALLNDVLDLSKAEAGQLSLAREPFDLRTVCEQSVELFALRAAAKGLIIYLHLDPAVPVWVCGDAPRLRQVLTNLLGNAVKFTERGEIALRVARAEDAEQGTQVHFRVSDTGVGVPSDQLEHVFGAFAQVDATPGRRHGGTGLGLAICRELVQRMGGRIWLESEQGVGSTFHALIDLPPAPSVMTAGSEHGGGGVHGPCLVVEPATGLGAALADLARAAGHAPVRVLPSFADLRQAAAFGDERLICRAALLDDSVATLPPGLRVLALVDGHRLGACLERLKAFHVVEYLVMPATLADFTRPRSVDEPRPTAAPAATETASLELANGPPRRLLLVDDSADNRQLVRAFLRGQAWEVTEAADGAEAVALAVASRYDLILMDIQMPGMDGYAATAAIRSAEQSADRTAMRIVALSAHTAQEDIERALSAGCDAYLVKPLRKASLLDCLSASSGGGAGARA